MIRDRSMKPSSDAERVRVSVRGSRARLVTASAVAAVFIVGTLMRPSSSLVDSLGGTPVALAVLVVLLVVILGTARILFMLPVMQGLVPGLAQIGRVLAIDAPGIWYIQKRQRILLRWQDIAGVGFTEDPDNKFNFIIEIYPRDAARCGDEELLRQWMVDGGISHHGMPSQRLAFPPMRLDPIREKLSPAVRAYARRSWVGGRPYLSSQRIPGS